MKIENDVFSRLGLKHPRDIPTEEEVVNLLYGYLSKKYEDVAGSSLREGLIALDFGGYFRQAEDPNCQDLIAMVRVELLVPPDQGVLGQALRANKGGLSALYLFRPWAPPHARLEFVALDKVYWIERTLVPVSDLELISLEQRR
ncbi:MAG: hypothetical protein ACE5D3_05550 [Candidatus Binatia bacterium]